jgi:general secretion pathway protein G
MLQTMKHFKPQPGRSRLVDSQKGFTLLEIIVVVTIIAILAAYIAPKIAGRADDARISKAKSDIRVLESSMELYKLDNFTYPNTGQGLDALVNKPSGEELKHWRKGGYIKKLNKDPWGNDYQYRIPGTNSEFDIYSFGSDSAVGGSDTAADIGNWNLDS